MAVNTMSTYIMAPQLELCTPFGCWGLRGSKVVQIEISIPLPHSTCIHRRRILHRLAAISNAADRQTTDRRSEWNRQKRHLLAFCLKRKAHLMGYWRGVSQTFLSIVSASFLTSQGSDKRTFISMGLITTTKTTK